MVSEIKIKIIGLAFLLKSFCITTESNRLMIAPENIKKDLALRKCEMLDKETSLKNKKIYFYMPENFTIHESNLENTRTAIDLLTALKYNENTIKMVVDSVFFINKPIVFQDILQRLKNRRNNKVLPLQEISDFDILIARRNNWNDAVDKYTDMIIYWMSYPPTFDLDEYFMAYTLTYNYLDYSKSIPFEPEKNQILFKVHLNENIRCGYIQTNSKRYARMLLLGVMKMFKNKEPTAISTQNILDQYLTKHAFNIF